MMNRKALILLSVVAVAVIITGSVVAAYAVEAREQRFHNSGGLTAEQKAVIEQKIQEMRKNGASPKEIRAAIIAMLREWGISNHTFPEYRLHELFRRIRRLIHR